MTSIGIIPVLYNAHGAIDAPPMAAGIATRIDYTYIIFSGPQNSIYDQLKRLQAASSKIKILYSIKPLGKGGAVLKGLKHSLKKFPRANFIQVDGDLEQSFDDIPLFLREIQQAQGLVIGDRYASQKTKLPPHRKGAITLGTGIINAMTGFSLTDVFCGFRAYPGPLAHKFLEQVRAPTYGLEVEQNLIARLHKFSAKNIPLSFAKQQHPFTNRQKIIDNMEVFPRYPQLLEKQRGLEPSIQTIIRSLKSKNSFKVTLPTRKDKIKLKFKLLKKLDAYSILALD